MFKLASLCAGALMAAALTMPASAASITVSASGTFFGSDASDLLGYGLGDIADVPFTLALTFNLDDAQFTFEPPFPGASIDTHVAAGGSIYGRPSLGSIFLTAGSTDFVFSGAFQGTTLQNDGVVQQSIDAVSAGRIVIGAEFIPAVLEPLISGAPAGNICLSATCYGRFEIAGIVGFLEPDSYVVAYDGAPFTLPPPPAPVPEPAAWGLMIIGFGAAGATLRRRRALIA